MKIKEISIENFRSYYRRNTIAISDGLTLIIGANGEGKTNFYRAVVWFFADNIKMGKERDVSRKALSCLLEGSSLKISVSFRFEHNENEYYVERFFTVSKDFDSKLTISKVEYKATQKDGVQSFEVDATSLLDNCFNSSIRNYSILAGEEDLHKLNEPDTVSLLIRNFSSLKNFEYYNNFLKFAAELSQKAADNVASKNAKNKKLFDRTQALIDKINRSIAMLEQDHKAEVKKVTDYTTQINELADKREAIELMKDIQKKIESLKKKRSEASSRIRDNYSIKLLDDLWILCGMKPILDIFSEKVSKFSKERRKAESIYQREQGARGLQKLQLAGGKAPLPLYTPSAKDLKEMLKDEICKVCGRPAPKGSPEWHYMEDKLNLYLESLNIKEPEEFFKHHYIQELDKRETILNNDMAFVTGLNEVIKDVIAFNEARKAEVQKFDKNIELEEENERKVLAQVPGASTQTLLNSYTNISNWFENRSAAEKNIIRIEHELEQLKEQLEEQDEIKAKIAKDSPATMYVLANQAIARIKQAFKNAEYRNKQAFIEHLNSVANEYLAKLNIDDFKGIVRLSEGVGGILSIRLIDEKGIIIEPNKALETTMYMSVLFAVSQLNEDKLGNESPLIFDAPTSSFTTGKEDDFYRVIDKVDKQIIIATKSFLIDQGNNNYALDLDRINGLNIRGEIYRIEKLKPFNDKDLSTIQTIITKVPH